MLMVYSLHVGVKTMFINEQYNTVNNVGIFSMNITTNNAISLM